MIDIELVGAAEENGQDGGMGDVRNDARRLASSESERTGLYLPSLGGL